MSFGKIKPGSMGGRSASARDRWNYPEVYVPAFGLAGVSKLDPKCSPSFSGPLHYTLGCSNSTNINQMSDVSTVIDLGCRPVDSAFGP